MTKPRVSRLLRTVVATIIGTTFASPALATEPPIAAPGQVVPPHAAGGWPTDLTGDDAKPKRTPEQEAHLNSVAEELKRLANEHGPDSVVLQSKFLVRSMSTGAVGPTEVRVAGPSEVAGAGHLEIDIDTGLYFDEITTTEESRREAVWKDVALPVLDEMVSFKIDPAGLELVFLFDVQKRSPEHGFSPSEEHRREGFRVTLAAPFLEDLAGNEVAGDAVRAKVELVPSNVVRSGQDVVIPGQDNSSP